MNRFVFLFLCVFIMLLTSCDEERSDLSKKINRIIKIIESCNEKNDIYMTVQRVSFDEFLVLKCGDNKIESNNKGMSCNELTEKIYGKILKRRDLHNFIVVIVHSSLKKFRNNHDVLLSSLAYEGYYSVDGKYIFDSDFNEIKNICE